MFSRMLYNRILIIAGVFFLLGSCTHNPDLESIRDISFSSDIQPIIAGNCTQSGCHNDQGDSEFSLITYDDVINNGEVRAGNANGSKLYKAISNHSDKIMPPPPSLELSSDQIKLVYIWIEQGAKNN